MISLYKTCPSCGSKNFQPSEDGGICPNCGDISFCQECMGWESEIGFNHAKLCKNHPDNKIEPGDHCIEGLVQCSDGPCTITGWGPGIDISEVIALHDSGGTADEVQAKLEEVMKKGLNGRECHVWVTQPDGSVLSVQEDMRRHREKKEAKFGHISIDELRRRKKSERN